MNVYINTKTAARNYDVETLNVILRLLHFLSGMPGSQLYPFKLFNDQR